MFSIDLFCINEFLLSVYFSLFYVFERTSVQQLHSQREKICYLAQEGFCWLFIFGILRVPDS